VIQTNREAMVEGPGKRSKDDRDITDIVSNKEKVQAGKDDNIIPAKKGTSRSYTISRLQREAMKCDHDRGNQYTGGKE